MKTNYFPFFRKMHIIDGKGFAYLVIINFLGNN